MSSNLHDLLAKAREILSSPASKEEAKATARQLLFLSAPLSTVVETYLYDNEGRPQSLEKFQMMRAIYDGTPQRLLLKCSRKTLKSTLLSNMIALNLLRYKHYKMLYVAPQETSTKYFSNNYLNARFESPPLKAVLRGFTRNDVFEKILEDTGSSVILRYCKEDASRIRGPATDQNIHDEVQDMSFETLPIIKETMALSAIKREMFAGTPLTTDNTINELWKTSSQCEWMTKCTGCNHWNSLTMDNDPMKMILQHGISCSKCGKVIDTNTGEWVEFNPGRYDLIGYHLAQPILSHFNQDPREWAEIYKKVHNTGAGRYSQAQIYNEVFGLAFDTGSKPITEEQLKKLSVLGDIANVYERGRHRYLHVTVGVDWGVNMDTSRTAVVAGGLREDGIFEVFYAKILRDFAYEQHIYDIANLANAYGAFCACDGGPDPARGKMLAEHTSWQRTQLVRYEDGLVMQYYKSPPNAIHPAQNRWCLHRSDTMTFTFNLLKEGKILFPNWEQMNDCHSDTLNIFVEVKEGVLRQELVYRHPADKPDDFFHALNFAVCQAHLLAGNPVLNAPSSSALDADWQGGNHG